MKDGWEAALNYNASEAEITLAGSIITEKLAVNERVKRLLLANHKANSVAAWVTKSSILLAADPFTTFDHSGEMAVALDLNTSNLVDSKSNHNRFDFRARCFRCRTMFCYKQVPHATYAEGDFPNYWYEGQNYGIF
jgi:hypothetical protein